MENNLINQLEQLHLSPNEATIYLALLETGQTSAGPLISKTQFHRSVVYDALDKLIAKQLAFKLEKNNITYFQASNPEHLLRNIRSQELIAQALIPQLQNMVDISQPEITIHQGLDSYRRFWLTTASTLPIGSTDYIAGSIGQKWQELMGPDTKRFLKLRLKRQIKWQMIIFDKNDLEIDLLKKYPALHKYRFVNQKISPVGNFNIFNNDTIVLHSALEPMVIEIKSTILAQVFRDIFNILWKTGQPIK